jgi:hypothetical protein
MSLAMAEDEHLMGQLPDRLRKDLAGCFKRLFSDPADVESRSRLTGLVEQVLALDT